MKKLNVTYSLLLICMLGLLCPVHAQPQGKLLVRNHDLVEIGSESGAFWSALKDSRGMLYFGGEQAVHEYDGTNWRRIEIPNQSVVRSLAMGSDGTIYVGAVSEFGYLEPDSAGMLKYRSLLDKLEGNVYDFPDVWSVNVIGETVYFQSANKLFVYWNGSIRSVSLKESYHRSFVIEDRLLINQTGIGLSYLNGGQLELMPGGAFFKDKIISSITKFDGGKLLIGTRKFGLYVYDPELLPSNVRIESFKSEANEFLKINQLYHGIELPGNRYAFASLRKGVIIVNSKGEIQNYINKLTGSNDYTAYFLYLANNAELWIATAKGISMYNINSAVSYWDEELGLFGSINDITENNGKIWVGTYSGLFYLDQNGVREHEYRQAPALFRKDENIDSEVWSLMLFNPNREKREQDNMLLAATGQGLYNVSRRKIEFEIGRMGQLSLAQSSKNPTIIYLNTHPTFYVLQYLNGKWVKLWETDVSSYITSIVEDSSGDVWIGTNYYGVFRINLAPVFAREKNRNPGPISQEEFMHVSVKNFDMSDGLPSLAVSKALRYRDKLLISCQGLYCYDSKTDRIVKADYFGPEIKEWDKTLQDIEEDNYGNIWGLSNEILDKQPDGSFRVVKLPYEMLTIRNSTLAFHHDSKGSTWIGGEHSLLRYNDKEVSVNNTSVFRSVIRKVTFGGDSILFGGTFMTGNLDSSRIVGEQPDGHTPSIKYSTQSIAFEYSSPYFKDDIPLEYSYLLEGYTDKWSPWSSNTYKEYNNLREKTYVFRVRARNYAGEISEEATFRFTITPPWQRTILAYVLFMLAIVTSIVMIIRVYVNNLKQSNIHLEKLVKERTSILESQKEEINKQAEKLKIQNDKLRHQRNRMSEMSKEILRTNRDKLRFFTNISHELRTPLTLILGPVEELTREDSSLSKEQVRTKLETVYKNARRLLVLVNQILDFRKLEISKPRLSASEGDIVAFVGDLTSCFSELAKKKNIDLVFAAKEKTILSWYDPDKIGKILFNLISNAFKYTDEGGKIKVTIWLGNDRYNEGRQNESIFISVKDNGIGMDEELIPRIFDRFFHSSSSVTLEEAGSGIGLSMASQLAEIHCGKIEVESELGVGSEFTLIIPFGSSYLKEDEKESSADQNAIKSFDVRAKMEVINHLNVSSREKITKAREDSDKKLVLLVEDSSDLRAFIIDELSIFYDFIEAENGQEGYEMAMRMNPEIIITDVLMPVMDGLEFCSKVKSTLEISHIPIILLTSKSEVEDHKRGLEVGAEAFLTKPFNMQLLKARIDNLIQSANRFRERFSKDLVFKPTDIVVTSTDEKFLVKALSVVEKNMSNHQFGVDLFAQEMAMSQSTLYRKLKALTGESTNNFIKEFRLKQAAHILSNNEVQVSEVSYMVGFDDPAYFAKSFKQKFGKSPSEYARSNED